MAFCRIPCKILIIFIFRYIFYHPLHCFIILFVKLHIFSDVLLPFTNSMFAVYCSSANYALAVSGPPFLLDWIFFPEIFRILWKHVWLYYWQAKHSSDSIEQFLGTFHLLFLKKKNYSMTSFRSLFSKNGSLYFF